MEGITQESVDKIAAEMKKQKSFWYKLKVNWQYKKLNRKIQHIYDSEKATYEDARMIVELLKEQKKLINTGLITKRNLEKRAKRH